MFGIKHEVNLREVRKRLLIAESDLNRVRLRKEGRALTDEFGKLADRARSAKTVAAAILPLLGGLLVLLRLKAAPAAPKSSWFQKLLTGARMASTIWLLFRSRGADSDKSPPAPTTKSAPS